MSSVTRTLSDTGPFSTLVCQQLSLSRTCHMPLPVLLNKKHWYLEHIMPNYISTTRGRVLLPLLHIVQATLGRASSALCCESMHLPLTSWEVYASVQRRIDEGCRYCWLGDNTVENACHQWQICRPRPYHYLILFTDHLYCDSCGAPSWICNLWPCRRSTQV